MTFVFRSLIAAVGAVLGYFIGNFDGLLYALVFLIIADYITGIMCAVIKKELSSNIGFKGIFKKICIFILVGIGYILDILLLNETNVFHTVIIIFYIANECISILENAAFLGLPIPDNLIMALHQLKKKGDDKDRKDN